MIFKPTIIPEVVLVLPRKFSDSRGFFMEFYNQKLFNENSIKDTFVQSNHSMSIKNTLRGLHYQKKHPQSKLVRCIKGRIFDVAVDIRKKSPTYGKWVGEILSEENHNQLYIPKGFAHGFLVLSDIAEVTYMCSEFYYPKYDSGILWNDSSINIDWNIKKPILSDKDSNQPLLKNILSK